MVVHDIYSRRKKRELGELPDVFTYDRIVPEFRRQIIQMWEDAIGIPYHTDPQNTSKIQGMYLDIAKILRREYGLRTLTGTSRDPNEREFAYEELTGWFLNEVNIDRILDGVEVSFRVIHKLCSSSNYLPKRKNSEIANVVIRELNARFKEHGIGFQYVEGEIIRIDSAFIHAEAVIPALVILRDPAFTNAQSEFLKAFEHYRHGRYAEALVDCYKSFESTMKIICNKRGWAHNANASASELVKVCLDNKLIPEYWQSHFAGLRSVLESGIPTPRNRQAGHGAGTIENPIVPSALVSYVLHMTAATILFLYEMEKALP
jgi:AbiJ N-terminal domain 4